jgi:2-dehydropantoate 2-reductase
MRILVVGAGAMGSLFAARLKKGGHEVSLLERVKDRVEEINERGIRVEGVGGKYVVKVQALSSPPRWKPNLILICVKAYDTRKAAEAIRKIVGAETVILTLQNGVGNVEILSEVLGKERVLGGVTAEGATLLSSGRVRHAGQGDTILQQSPLSDSVVQVFQAAGFRTRAEADVRSFIWGKLIVNVGINALAAITRLRNGRIPELESLRAVMATAVAEAVAVCTAMKLSLPFPDPTGKVEQVCRDTAGNVASMLQDILKHRKTEIEFINGAVVREGKKAGIPTPVNATLTGLVTALEETHAERLR